MTMTDERVANPGMDENTSPTGSGHESDTPPFADDNSGSVEQVQAKRGEGEKEKCEEPGCGKMILTRNMNQHRRDVHGIYLRKGKGKKGAATEPKPDRDVAKEKTLTTDEIVAVVVQMRWPHHMPSNKMPALLEWRAATERFLNG